MAIAVLCLGGAAPVAAAGPRACGECGGCKKRRCKFDDNCFYDATARTCQDVGADVCRGIQRDHGKKAPADTGGRGGKKKLPGHSGGGRRLREPVRLPEQGAEALAAQEGRPPEEVPLLQHGGAAVGALPSWRRRWRSPAAPARR